MQAGGTTPGRLSARRTGGTLDGTSTDGAREPIRWPLMEHHSRLGEQNPRGELTLFDDEETSRGDVVRALDELVGDARRYRSSADYRKLLNFVADFRGYSAFNAMLVHLQMEGATFVAPAARWRSVYHRRVTGDARPLVILRPFGPVMLVFDVSHTEPRDETAPPLPPEVTDPFAIRAIPHVEDLLARTRLNAVRDGVRLLVAETGSRKAGQIGRAEGADLEFTVRRRPPTVARIPLRYEMQVNSRHDASTQYATVVHELAHLYCGHLGTPNSQWWPQRASLSHRAQEFEAESIAFLVCRRSDSSVRFPPYLAQHLDNLVEVPPISLERVMVVTDLIARMGTQWLGLRPAGRGQPENP